MSSILTNNGAMVALQTLKSINSDMASTQSQISTGKNVASAKDNSAVWAISKVMEADVKGFQGISDSLNLGQSTVSVARQASETVTELLTDIKGKVVAAQEENVDRDKIQTDIDALRDQIGAVVGAAQFNGLNLLQNQETTAGSGSVNVLASLDRSSSGVAASDITVAKQDLGTNTSDIDYSATATAAASDDIAVGGVATQAAVAVAGSTTATANTTTVAFGSAGTDAAAAGAGFQLQITADGGILNGLLDSSDGDMIYVARDGDTMADVAAGLTDKFNSHIETALGAGNTNGIAATVSGNTITISGATSVLAADTFSVNAEQYGSGDTTIGGGLEDLAGIDVTTQANVDQALTDIEGLIQTSIDAAASFGSVQGRIETQSEFISGLTDALKSGIGTLVDADMEETSAKLQALQVQQQLGVQALSIANQAPQQLLSLFR
ncbi:MAG: flagellin [Pelagimonas sp.]